MPTTSGGTGFILFLLAGAFFLPCWGGPGATNGPISALQEGLFEEEANHNLDAAIAAYQSVVNQFDQDRKLAATAVFRLGECYHKQGKTNEAVAQYQRVLHEFSEQGALTQLSQQTLAGLGFSIPATGVARLAPPGAPATASDPAQVKMLQEEIKLVEQQLGAAQARFNHGKAEAREVAQVQRELLALKRQLPENADLAAQKALLDQEMKLVEDRLKEVRKKIEVGAAAPLDEVPVKRDLLSLQRQLAALTAPPPTAAAAREGATATYEEQQEILRIQTLLRDSPDLINASSGRQTLLQTAAGKGQLSVVRLLLDSGAAVNGIKQPDLTPLHYAAGNGRKAIVDLLLQRGAKVAAETENGVTPLHLAALKGYTLVAKTLIEAGAPVNAQTHGLADWSSQATPLQYKIAGGSSPLHLAVANGYAAIVELLAAAKADLNAPDSAGNTPLVTAVAQGQKVMVELLLNRGADINATDLYGDTALRRVAQNGNQELLAVLLAHKANVNTANKSGWTPLHLAVDAGQKAAVEALLAAGAEVNARKDAGETPLLLAAKAGAVEVVSALLAAKADANAATGAGDHEGWAPLHYAVSSDPTAANAGMPGTPRAYYPFQPAVNSPKATYAGYKAVAGLLLEHGANPDLPIIQAGGKKGSTPLWLAALAKKADMVALLLEHRANPKLADDDGHLPLPLAIRNGNLEMASALLQHGADANTPDEEGVLPLSSAVEQRRKDLVDLLLAHHANPNLKNRNDSTPLDLVKPAPAGFPQRTPRVGPAAAAAYAPPPMALAGWPLPGVPGPSVPAAPPRASDGELAALLRQHGALEDLPRLDQIEVRRRGTGYRNVLFMRGTNDFNCFSLLELVAVEYGVLTTGGAGQNRTMRVLHQRTNPPLGLGVFRNQSGDPSPLPFPDFAQVTIRRPTPDGKGWDERKVDLGAVCKAGDCAGDMWLDWGALVDIPETDHPIDEQWPGLSDEVLATLKKCLTRQVEIVVKRQANKYTVAPDITIADGKAVRLLSNMPFMLVPVLYDSKLLLASSDLSRIKVTRQDTATGQTRELVVDRSNRPTLPGIWLRDGDVIEVPEK